MSKKCIICNEKLGIMHTLKIQNEYICYRCANISKSYQTETIDNIKKYWKINNERLSIFSKTETLKSIFSDIVNIDSNNKLIIFGKLEKVQRPIVFTFDEVLNYNFETVGTTTVTKKKGGITRAVVGGIIAGPVGSVIGSNTAKEETITTGGTKILKINFLIPSGNYQIILSSPPQRLTDFLDKCILSNTSSNKNESDNIDKIKRYKELLDIGAITEEEFSQKKEELLEIRHNNLKDLDVEKYQILATLDSETCKICGDMDLKIFDMKDYKEGITAPPFHKNCRCCINPYFEDEDSTRIARNTKTGETYYVNSNMNYKQWKKSLN